MFCPDIGNVATIRDTSNIPESDIGSSPGKRDIGSSAGKCIWVCVYTYIHTSGRVFSYIYIIYMCHTYSYNYMCIYIYTYEVWYI